MPVYDIGRTDDGCCYVVSKWIRGSDLKLRLSRERVSEREAARLVMAVADARSYGGDVIFVAIPDKVRKVLEFLDVLDLEIHRH